MACGSVPTAMVLTFFRLTRCTTDTVPLALLATYARGFRSSVATERGSSPTGSSFSLVSCPLPATLNTDTVSVSVLAATTLVPSAVMAIGPDLLLPTGCRLLALASVSVAVPPDEVMPSRMTAKRVRVVAVAFIDPTPW